MNRVVATLVQAISVSAWICSPALGAAAGESPDVRAGRDLFEQHCELCHGADGKGDGPISDELRVAPANLTEIALRRGGEFPEVEVREIIDGRRRVRAHGHSEMPVWGRVFGGPAVAGNEVQQAAARVKLDRLVAYLRSIQATSRKDVSQR